MTEATPSIGFTDPDVDLLALSPVRLQDMAVAGRDYLDCQRELKAKGRSIIDEMTDRLPYPYTHYPKGDVYDALSHAQYYFHIHREGEHGHFHTFLRPRGMPDGIKPADPADHRPPGDNDALSHLVAIAIDADGTPDMLFTTNRWVTAETWYKAADVKAMLPCFHIGHDRPSDLLNRWITDLVVLFRPQIERLLDERDATIERYHFRLPGIPVLDDRELEVMSRMIVDPARQIAQVLELL
ncbi:MAG TPA: hypothetical protein VM661_01855 [Candidatus Sulfotelmatobacter sp.]|jgi:hypothetical protein|nr:hypothetical protein [Candidatus Sulfotelmatobacter sp.]